MVTKSLHTIGMLLCVLCILLGLLFAFSLSQLSDFGSFYEVGRAVQTGHNPYGVYPLTGHADLPGYFHLNNPNLNPPFSVLPLTLFSLVDPFTGAIAWKVANCILYLVALLILAHAYPRHRRGFVPEWTLALAAFWVTVAEGQIYVVVVLLVVGTWLTLRSGYRVLPGLMLGYIAAFKPFFLVWIALLFLAGYWLVSLIALVTTLVLSAIPLVLFGPTIYAQWIAVLRADPNRIAFPTNISLVGVSAQLGAPVLGYGFAILLLVAVALWAWRRKPAILDVSAVALVVMLLASPIAWFTYSIFLLPIFFHRTWNWALTAAALLLLFPFPLVGSLWMASGSHLLALGVPWGLALPLILLGMTDPRRVKVDRLIAWG